MLREAPPRPPLLRVSGLRKAYGPQVILDGVDLTVEPGTLTAVTGPNGSGKSTLLRCLAGLADHDGEVQIDGVPLPRARRKLGYLPQAVELSEWATVGEVLQFFARLRRVDPQASTLGPGFLPPAETPVRVLSGGQARRLALAIALLGSPELLLLDEPAASLDEDARSTLWEVLEERIGQGVAVLIARPSGPDTNYVPDRVMELSCGRLLEKGTRPAEVREVVS